ncbi:MAG: hypothetical protein KDC13_07005 [Bacteroidetes bacterium]|nr:hypothetical protein [Bacteroidota bacterium]
MFWPGVLITAIFSAIAGWFLPWWILLPLCFLLGMLLAPVNRSPFLRGFTAVFLVWASFAWWLDFQNDSILSIRLVQLFPLPQSAWSLILLTGFLGGLQAGFVMKAGDLLRRMYLKD